jgi:hypothetical protein
MSPFLGPARHALCSPSPAAALLQCYHGARARDRVDFYERKSVTWRRAELHHVRTLALRISILSALFITSYSAVQRAQAQEAVGTMTRNAPRAETAPPDLVNSAEAPFFQATQAPTDSSIVDLNGRQVAETPRRFHYSFQLVVRGVYDDNINLTQTQKSSDFYTSIEPTISLGLGGTGEDQTNFLAFVYAPNVFIFADHSNADAFQHVIHLAGQRQFARLTLNVGEDIQILDSTNLTSLTDTTGRQANIDVGRKTRANIFDSKLGASYDLSSKTFLTASADYLVYNYPSLISSETVSGSLFFNYNYGAKIVVGVGGTGGYDKAEGSTPDQYFEQGNLRLSYQVTGKISFSATGGIEVREFGGARGEYISPVYDLSANYQPFDGTSVSLTGSRTTRNSAVISGGDFASTKIDLGLRQRLFQRIFIGLNGGYENDDYFSATSSVDVSRTDNYYYFQSSIDVNVTRFWTVGAYYLHRQDISSLDNFKFSDNQVGGRTSLSF